MKSTLARLLREVDAVHFVSTHDVPSGHFKYSVTMGGVQIDYVLQGDPQDPSSVIIGRIERGVHERAYLSNGLGGGAYMYRAHHHYGSDAAVLARICTAAVELGLSVA